MLRKVSIIMAAALLTGCAAITYQSSSVTIGQIEKIKTGMTVNEVQQILGKPYKISHLYEGPRDENIFIHQYPVKYNVYPFDVHNEALGPLSEKQIKEKFTYRNSRFFDKGTFTQIYFLQFVFEDSLLIKFEPMHEGS